MTDRMSTCRHHSINFRSDYKNWDKCDRHDIPINCDICKEYEPIPEDEPITNEERLIRMAEAISKMAFSVEILLKAIQTVSDMVASTQLEVHQMKTDEFSPIISIKEPVCARKVEGTPYNPEPNLEPMEPPTIKEKDTFTPIEREDEC